MRLRLHHLSDFLVILARRLCFTRWVPIPIAQSSAFGRRGKKRARCPARCFFERLEAREVFNATYHGGALIPHVEAQAVFLGSQWTTNSTLITEAAAIDNMLAYTVQSPYMDLLTDAGYNVGQGTATTGARISVSLAATTTDANIRSLLQQAITLKLVEQPDLNRLYLVYTPNGINVNNNGATSQTTFLGYHGAFAGTDSNNIPFDIHYVVVPHPGTPNPTSTTNGFTGATEVQTLTLGGGTAIGSLTPAFNGVFATTSIFRSNEVQTLKFNGAGPDTVRLSFNGVGGSDATLLTFVSGTSPSAAQVQAHLATIPALNGNVSVTGNAGGPLTITFINALANVNSSAIVATASGSSAPAIATVTDGALPTAAQVQTSLGTIAALSGNVTVTGNAGGPYTITIRNLGNAPAIDVTGVTGGLTASITTNINGTAGITSDIDQLMAVSAHEMVEAVTDPDVNYKTLGWYDDPSNVEIADLGGAVADVTTRLGTGGFLTANVFNQTHQVITPDTTSIDIITTLANATTTGALADVTISQVSATEVKVSWKKVDAGASGYRVLRVDGSKTTLLARVPASATSVNIPGLPTFIPITLKVEAYNAADVTDLVTRTITLELPALQKPIITAATALSATSAKISWTSAAQLLTLGGDSAGTLQLAYNGVNAATTLNRIDEVQTLTISGPDAGTIQLSFDGVAGTTTTQLTISAGVSPTADEVEAHLATIPALSSSGAVTVTGPLGGPFVITFGAGLSGENVPELTVTTANGAIADVDTTTDGSSPTAAQVAAHLATIPALAGQVAVTGDAGGPYTITVTAAPLFPISVASVTDGLVAAVNAINGATGFRIFSVSGTTQKLLATLPATASTATINGLKANSKVTFFVEAFRGSLKSDSANVSVQLTSLTAPVVTRTPIGTTAVKLSWPLVAGAKGYRVYRLGANGKRILLSTRSASTSSITITGLPASTKYQVEAFAGPSIAASPWV